MSRGAITYGEVGDHKARSKSLCTRGQMGIVGRKGAVDQHDIEPQIGGVVGEQLDVLGGREPGCLVGWFKVEGEDAPSLGGVNRICEPRDQQMRNHRGKP